MPPMPLLFITTVKDICTINTFEKLLNILFSEVYYWCFGFTTLLFSGTITDMSPYEVLNLFPRRPLVFRSFLHPWCSNSRNFAMHDVLTRRSFFFYSGNIAGSNLWERMVDLRWRWWEGSENSPNDAFELRSKKFEYRGKVSAQPHTIVKQICFPNGNVLFL